MVKEKSLSVEEMRDILTKDGAYSLKELAGVKKSKLREMVETLDNVENILNSVSVSEDTNVVPVNEGETAFAKFSKEIEEAASVKNTGQELKPTDIGWTAYILTLFSKDELDNNCPRVDGLRRVAELIYGPFNIITDVIDSPRIDNAGRASVVVRLQFLRGSYSMWQVDGAADVFSGNTDREFARHAIATAETRAEGRALRKALKLTKVLSAEETYNAEKDEADGSDGRIVQSMITNLNVMAGRVGVDPLKTAIKMDFDVQTIEELNQKQALKLAEQFGRYQRTEDEIPEEVKS